MEKDDIEKAMEDGLSGKADVPISDLSYGVYQVNIEEFERVLKEIMDSPEWKKKKEEANKWVVYGSFGVMRGGYIVEE